jgi:hypothetical protein
MKIEGNYMNLTNKWFGNEQELNNFVVLINIDAN